MLSMTGAIRDCVLLSYRVPTEAVAGLVPRRLEPVAHGGFAFWNIVACRIERMRPAGLPGFVGMSYHHVAYRLHVRAAAADGRMLDGLYFVRSDADSTLVSWGGNLFSDFCFHVATIRLEPREGGLRLEVAGSAGGLGDARFTAVPAAGDDPAPGSCFADRRQRESVLKYRPVGLAPTADGSTAKLAEVFRDESAWREEPLAVTESDWPLFRALQQPEPFLERATRVAPLPYRWRLGRREPLAGSSPH